MNNDLDCMHTVQCKSIEPANTNIHSATHAPSRQARTNITRCTTPHIAKACRQMEASSNANSASLGTKNQTRIVYRVATLAQFSCHKQKHGKPMHSHERVTESGQQQPYCQAKARQSHPRGWELCTNTCLPCPMPAKACPSQEQHDHHQFPHKFIQISIFWSNSIKNVHEFDWNDEKSNEIAGENTLRRSFCLPAVPIGAPRACRAYPHTHPPPIYDWKAIFSFVEKVHFFPCIHKFLKVLKSGPRRRIFFWIFLWLLGTLKQAKPRKNRNIPMSDELITNFSAETSQRADTT
jgi:hypothetical protein